MVDLKIADTAKHCSKVCTHKHNNVKYNYRVYCLKFGK